MTDLQIRKIVRVLRVVEFGDGHKYEGDGGRAIGPWQYHPAAFWDWADKPTPGATWEQWFHDTCYSFLTDLFAAFPSMAPEEAAIVFHRYHYLRRMAPGDTTKDNYFKDFQHAWTEDTYKENDPKF